MQIWTSVNWFVINILLNHHHTLFGGRAELDGFLVWLVTLGHHFILGSCTAIPLESIPATSCTVRTQPACPFYILRHQCDCNL